MRTSRPLSLSLLALLLAHAPRLAAQALTPEQPFDLTAAIASGPPLTAARAAERAVESAPSLERTAALTRAADAALSRARDQLLPRLELSARYTHIDGFPNGRIEGPSLPGLPVQSGEIEIPRDQVALGARISWPVSDLFFAIAPAIDAARAGRRASEAQHEARLAQVRLQAQESFYALARARGVLAVAERAVEQARVQKSRIDASVAAGLRTAADASSAAARLAAAEQGVASAEAAVDVADASLRTLLQDGEGALYGIAEPLVGEDAPNPPAIPVLLEEARARRPELRALRDGISVQRHTTDATHASGYPHLAIYAGADYARPNRYVIPPKAEFQPSWEVGAALTYAPNDTLVARHRVRENQAQLDALAADLRELDRQLVLEVRRARAALVRSARVLEAARASESAASDAYARRLAELAAGEVTTADLFSAETELQRARLDVLDGAIEQRLASARLAYAIGR